MKKYLAIAVLMSSFVVLLSSTTDGKNISKVAETAPPSPLANYIKVV